MLPIAVQGRRAIWEAVNSHSGKRRIDEAFPQEFRETTRENEMMIRFKNGSAWHVVGSDAYDQSGRIPPAGVVYSEWALADPASWGYLRPILAENDGWALFITTPRGNNHAKTMYDAAANDPTWYREVSPATATGVFTAEQLEIEKREYMAQFGVDQGRALYEQEYLCSFDAAVLGAFYAAELSLAREQRRIGIVPDRSHGTRPYRLGPRLHRQHGHLVRPGRRPRGPPRRLPRGGRRRPRPLRPAARREETRAQLALRRRQQRRVAIGSRTTSSTTSSPPAPAAPRRSER